MARSHPLFVSFNGQHIELACANEQLAGDLVSHLGHVATARDHGSHALLRLEVTELEPSWIELRDPTGRCARGSLDYVLHFIQKWMTEALVAAHPDLMWLHAGAASFAGAVVLLSGPSGAGKSTLVARLLERSWRLVADDVVPLDVERRKALPLPFNPSVRSSLPVAADDRAAFLEQPKVVVSVPPDRVARRAVPIGAIVFLEYAAHQRDQLVLTPLKAVRAAQALAVQCLDFGSDKGRGLRTVWQLAAGVPAYHLSYGDGARAADELTHQWSRGFTVRSDVTPSVPT